VNGRERLTCRLALAMLSRRRERSAGARSLRKLFRSVKNVAYP
jgi:hypothetical protein